MNCGIYKIEFPNGEFYIGSSTNLTGRTGKHLRLLGANSHSNEKMQAIYNKHGAPKISFLLVCKRERLLAYEQILIDLLSPRINLSKDATRVEMTPEVRKKISIGQKENFKANPERARAISTRMKIQSSEKKEFYRNIQIKSWSDPEAKRKRIENMKGVKKKRVYWIGRNHSEESKLKISKSKTGIKQSEEAIRNRFVSRAGYRHTEETKEKIRKYWKERRATRDEVRKF